MKELTAEDFDGFIRDNDRVLVDFWAPWCTSCKAYEMLLSGIEQDYGDLVEFTKVNVDEQPELADRYGITGLPTVVLFSGGEPVFKEYGVLSKQRLIAALR